MTARSKRTQRLRAPSPRDGRGRARVVALLRASSGVDFGEHQPATFDRQLARRMTARRMRDVASYLELLRGDPAEVRSLHDALLVQVTSFFRDGASFDALKATAFPAILGSKPAGAELRAWAIGCATGEEVYSLAIALIEHLGGGAARHPILIFGTDLSDEAIDVARAGRYPEAALHRLGEERLRRFFIRGEGGYRVSPAVRECCIFARHDVARDPPFSSLDLVSCRNVLIYFGQVLQRRVLAMAHHCLREPGYLLLGESESAQGVAKWFAPTSRGSRVFRRRPGPSAFRFAPRGGPLPVVRRGPGTGDRPAPTADGALARQVDALLLSRHGPPGVVVNDRLEVLQFRGRTGPYLEPAEGAPRDWLLEQVRPGLGAPLRTALAQARQTCAEVRVERVAIEGGDADALCDLVVLPLKARSGGDRAFVVLFEARPRTALRPRGAARPRGGPARHDAAARVVLEEELAALRGHVAVLLDDHARAREALASANDDLVATNEELQSFNEELTAANDELRRRNQELQRASADFSNLLEAVELPIVMLDAGHRIRRFTRHAAISMGLAPTDVGRRITEVSLPVDAPDLEGWIARAMEGAALVEAEVQDRSERWHRLKVRAHRAPDGCTDGTVLSLVQIEELSRVTPR